MRFSKEIKQIIKSAKITNFPVGVSELKQIIDCSGWEVYSYKNAAEIIDNYNLHSLTQVNDSFVTVINNRIVIFYDENISPLDFPHIIAHEIGRVTLGYLDSTDKFFTQERDCEQFADELLNYAPLNKKLLYSCAGVIGLCLINRIIAGVIRPSNNLSIRNQNRKLFSRNNGRDWF